MYFQTFGRLFYGFMHINKIVEQINQAWNTF
jgi:hypothetical protein